MHFVLVTSLYGLSLICYCFSLSSSRYLTDFLNPDVGNCYTHRNCLNQWLQ